MSEAQGVSANARCVIGLMSGTSLDGVDAAWIETDGERISRTGAALTLAYDEPLRARLRAVLDRAPAILDTPGDAEITALSDLLADRHAEAVAAICAREGRAAELIGFHGQTILHDPARGRTWQIGNAARLAQASGCAVVHDFRTDDIAAGGQGAPLVPLYHAALVASLPAQGPVAVLNIGGVANLTYLDGGTILAADTGPGNALLDDWALRHTGIPCDRDGALASAGRVDEPMLAALLSHPFFAAPAPKSLDRQSFAGALDRVGGLSPADGAATLVAFTAAAVAAMTLPAPPARWLVCGGGRHNPALMAALRMRLPGRVEPVDGLGWDGDALEAQCFGFLAMRSLRGLPISLPGTTGVREPLTGGRLTPAT